MLSSLVQDLDAGLAIYNVIVSPEYQVQSACSERRIA